MNITETLQGEEYEIAHKKADSQNRLKGITLK